jgi:hypothetical protein
MRSMHGVVVMAIRPGHNKCVFVGKVLKDEGKVKIHQEGNIIDICYLSIFGKYNQAVELSDGTIVRNTY